MKIKTNITAIIPYYNDGAYIHQAVNSLLAQTVVPENIIIINDGSNPETTAV